MDSTHHRLKGEKAASAKWHRVVRLPPPLKPSSLAFAPTSRNSTSPVARGLHLRALPKLPELLSVPALSRVGLPPCTTVLPTPQWVAPPMASTTPSPSFVTSIPSSVPEEYRATTLMDPTRHLHSIFHDVEEFVDPSVAGLSLAKIMEREERQEAECTTTTVASAMETSPPPTLTIIVAATSERLQETDLAHAVGMAASGRAEQVTDSLLATYHTECPREELLARVRSMLCVRPDVALFLREHTFQRLTSGVPVLQDVLAEITSLIDDLVGDQ